MEQEPVKKPVGTQELPVPPMPESEQKPVPDSEEQPGPDGPAESGAGPEPHAEAVAATGAGDFAAAPPRVAPSPGSLPGAEVEPVSMVPPEGPVGEELPEPAVQQVSPVPEVEETPVERESGPNWMLAFVCVWAGVTSLNEARVLWLQAASRAEILRTTGFLGYALLGLGLLSFSLEAMRWGRRRRGLAGAILVLFSVVLTLGGVICLFLSNIPGRRI